MSSAPRQQPGERRLEGLGVSPGIAIGSVYVREQGSLDIPRHGIKKKEVSSEVKRLKAAIRLAIRQIKQVRDGSGGEATPSLADQGAGPSVLKAANDDPLPDEMALLFEAYIHMLQDSRLVREAYRRVEEERQNAEAAVQDALNALVQAFQALGDSYIAARADDVREVGNRIIRNLMRVPKKAFSQAPEGAVIIADQLSPADTAQLDPAKVAGAATALGGAEGHAAILARALGLPMVLGVSDLMAEARRAERIILDGGNGVVILDPTDKTLTTYRKLRADQLKQERKLGRLRDMPALSRDGVEARLLANIELPIEMDMVSANGAEGIGLMRTEFLFMNRDDVPDEEEQFKTLGVVVRRMAGAPVTIRTLDVGGEKPAKALLGDLGEGAASALGLRGIRLSLTHPDVLEDQLCAILRAACIGPVRILLPMVSNVAEVRRARELINKSVAKLKRRKIAVPDPLPPLGVMIEVPAAALAADSLAQEADFFAIGSNDLTMYTLATDRSNEYVAHLYDSLHPAVLRLMHGAAQAAFRARIPISICGEMAGDPRYTGLLVGLGFRELSMAAGNIPKVKQRIREMDVAAASHRADAIMDQSDSGRIAMLVDDFNGL